MSAANGVASTSLATGQPVTVDAATLKTATDGTSGLNLNQDFTVEGTFALVAPNDISEEYGLRLTDRQSNQPPGPTNGDDVLDLAVRKVDSGGVVVQLRDLNFVDNTVTVLQTIGLNTSQFQTGEQIVLRLDHVAGSNDIAASFDLVDSSGNIISIGGTPQTYSFDSLSEPAQIFSDENWTRAQIIANSLTTDPSYLATDYGAFSIDPNTGDWNYSLRNGSNAVQGLGPGSTPSVPQDFTVQVADDQGATATTTADFTVNGINDAPVLDLNGPSNSGINRTFTYTEGDGNVKIAALGTAADIDSADFNGGSLTAAFTANGASEDQLTIITDGTDERHRISVTRGRHSIQRHQ